MRPARTRTVTYRCGCVVVLSEALGRTECETTCGEHWEPVRRIATVEEWP